MNIKIHSERLLGWTKWRGPVSFCFSLQNRALCAVQAHKRKVTTGRGSHNSDARPSARPGNYPGIETPSREALIPDLTAQSNVPEPFNLSRAQGPTPDVHTGEVRGCVFRCSKPILGPGGVEARGSFPCLHLHIHQSVTPNPGCLLYTSDAADDRYVV